MSTPTEQIEQLQTAIAAQAALRGTLPDAVVDATLAALQAQLAALEAQAVPSQQRKLVTVLFADVSGFTALSETMDPEVVTGIMNDLWAVVDKAIASHGGRIDKHIGDAVMALWGAEAAREDDPEMAVRAALAVLAAVHAFCESHKVPLVMRVGVNTGPVVFGSVATTHEFTALGDAVNLAARLEKAAPAGAVLISHNTYRQVRGIFDVQPQAPLPVKGKAEPVQTYVVLRAKPRAFRMATRGVEGIETRMIGRDAELLILQSAYKDAVEEAETRAVTIVGDAGIGKSRLLYEFDNWLELRPEPIYFFKGRAAPATRRVPYGLFRDLFTLRFQILDSDSPAAVLEKFRSGMAAHLEPAHADLVGQALGFDFSASEVVRQLLDDPGLADTARVYLTRYFRSMADEQPVVVFLEDIHWADDPSLDLVLHLTAALPAARLLVVTVARPALFERRPRWGEGEAAIKRIDLTPLPRRASRALVDEILQRVDQVPDTLRRLVIDAAEGNPFYVEELVKMLIDQGVIERGIRNYELGIRNEEAEGGGAGPAADDRPLTTDRWTVRTEKLEGLSVPPTLTGLLQARLDGLPRQERDALQRASVVGRQFWDEAVADLLETERGTVVPTLEASRQRELIFQREHSSFADAHEYVFKHNLLRDVAYETVLIRDRPTLHGRVARWLEARAGERLSEFAPVIAEHYVQAEDTDRAVDYLIRIGRQAVDRDRAGGARPYLERAMALLESGLGTRADDPRIRTLEFLLGVACAHLGDYDAAEQRLASALERARQAGDVEQQAVVLNALASAATDQGDFDRAAELADEALPLARVAGGKVLFRSLGAICFARLNMEGDANLERSEAAALEVNELAGSLDDPQAESKAALMLALVLSNRGQWARAASLYEDQLARHRWSGYLPGESTTLNNLGWISLWSGDGSRAIALFTASLAIERELHYKWNICNGLVNLALAYARVGDMETSADYLRESLEMAVAISARQVLVWGVVCRALLLLAAGRTDPALALLGLASQSPAGGHEVAMTLPRLLEGTPLSEAEIEAGLAAGVALDLDTVVQEILDGKW